MAISDAAKRADRKYKDEKTQRITVRFYPSETDIFEHLQSQESKQGYIKRLTREDMGTWYRRTCDEVECEACGFTTFAQDAAKTRECPRCGHGSEEGQR